MTLPLRCCSNPHFECPCPNPDPFCHPRTASRRMRSVSVAKMDSGSFADASSELYYSGNPVRSRANSLRQPAQSVDLSGAVGRPREQRSSLPNECSGDPAAASAQAGHGWLGAITAAYVDYEKANSAGAEALSDSGKQSRTVGSGDLGSGRVADTASMVRTTLAQQRGALASARQQAIAKERMAAILDAHSAAMGSTSSCASLHSKRASANTGMLSPAGSDALHLPATPDLAAPTAVQRHSNRRPVGRQASRLPVRSIGRASVPALPLSPFTSLDLGDDSGAQPLDAVRGQSRIRAATRSVSVAARAPAAASPFAAPSLQAISEFRMEALAQHDIVGCISPQTVAVVVPGTMPASSQPSHEPTLLETIHSGIVELPQPADITRQVEDLDMLTATNGAPATPTKAPHAIKQPETPAQAETQLPAQQLRAATSAAAPLISPFASQQSISPTASGTLIFPQGSGFASPFASHLTRFGSFASSELPHMQHASSVAAQVSETFFPDQTP